MLYHHVAYGQADDACVLPHRLTRQLFPMNVIGLGLGLSQRLCFLPWPRRLSSWSSPQWSRMVKSLASASEINPLHLASEVKFLAFSLAPEVNPWPWAHWLSLWPWPWMLSHCLALEVKTLTLA